MKIIEQHTVPAIDEKIRLQEYAPQVFKTITSRSGIKKAIKREEILLNGKVANTSDWIEEGQMLSLLQQEENTKKVFQLKLEIFYEDDSLAVVYKKPGYPTNGNFFKTIENALPFNLSKSLAADALPEPLPVHRLDNPTSGLLICAKTRIAQRKLSLAFEKRKIEKTYRAIVEGILPEIGAYVESIDEKEAKTLFNRKKNYSKENQNYSLVALFPQSGRTHQLRIHLSKNGFPIVGDVDYGSSITLKKGILLEAHSLQFNHPVTNEVLKFSSPFSKQFKNFVGKIKG